MITTSNTNNKNPYPKGFDHSVFTYSSSIINGLVASQASNTMHGHLESAICLVFNTAQAEIGQTSLIGNNVITS